MRTALFLLCFFLAGAFSMASTERIWSVAKATVEGKPIIYKFIADAPPLNI
nr:hypothetical protein [Pseudomonas sp. ALS1131]